jgi:hypothetical protein
MAVDFQIQFPANDVRALQRAMNRAQSELGITLGQSVKMAGSAVLRSMGASTKVAPKTRPAVVKTVLVSRTLKSGKQGKPRKVKQYGVEVYRQNLSAPVFQAVYGATNKTDVKRSKIAQINRRGLAKAAWVRIADRARISVKGEGVASGATKSKAWQKTSAQFNFKGDDPYFIMTNRLPHAMEALQGGPQDFASAMERGARAMMHTIDDKIKKALAKI